MHYWMSVTPLDKLPPGTWPTLTLAIDHINDNGDGTVVLVKPGGNSVSVQPGGEVADRPPGTDSLYERAVLTSNVITYQPDPTQPPYQYAISAMPN